MKIGNPQRTLLASLLLTTPLAFQHVSAASIEPPQNLRETAERFVSFHLQQASPAAMDNVEFEIGRPDPRLRLAKCDSELEAFFPSHVRTQGNTTVGVRCTGTQAWQIFLPARISRYERILVARRNLAKDQPISADDLMMKRINLADVRGNVFYELRQIIGTQPKRTVRAGTPLTDAMVCLVCQGDEVRVEAGINGLTVAMTGVALSDGSLGDRVMVRNTSSNKELQAQVMARGLVRVRHN